jgi:Integrase core domain
VADGLQGSLCHWDAALPSLDRAGRPLALNIVLQALDNERRASVQAVLQRAFERFGLPQRINTDNGPPWGSSGQGTVTQLGAWLIRLGVRLGYSRPLHPQTNGKDERFHRTLAAEVLAQGQFRDIDEAQHHMAQWRHVYNFERPHEALAMATPSSRYKPSTRRMPRTLPPVEYEPSDLVRRVQDGGWISLHGREFRTSTALAGQPVACRPLAEEDGSYAVFYCHQKVLEIRLTDP